MPAKTVKHVEKRRVVMTNTVDGYIHEAVDYVPVEHLDTYVADAKTRWPSVEVGHQHDPGPGGDHGKTFTDHLKGA